MEFLEKCGRTVFKIVSPTDDFETIKKGITLVVRLLQYVGKHVPNWTQESFEYIRTITSRFVT